MPCTLSLATNKPHCFSDSEFSFHLAIQPAWFTCNFQAGPSPGPVSSQSRSLWLSASMLGAVWMTSGQPFFFGRLPKKLLIPLILVTNLSSSMLTFLADNQNVLNSKTTFPLVSEYLVGLVGLQKPVGIICLLSLLLFKHEFKVCPQSRNKP